MGLWLEQQRIERQKQTALKLAAAVAALMLVIVLLLLFLTEETRGGVWLAGLVPILIITAICYRMALRYACDTHQLEQTYWENEERKIHSILESIKDGYYELDERGRFLAVNPALSEILGAPAHELLGASYQEYVGKQDALKLKHAFRWVSHTGTPVQQIDWAFVQRDGQRRLVEGSIVKISEKSGGVTGLRGIIRDVTDRRQAEQTINHMAYHDALTDLPNRRLFEAELTIALSQAKQQGQMMAILFFDLDRFKYINDSLGHYFGDCLLQSLSHRLKENVGSAGILARMGGDEFTMIFPAISDETEVIALADRIIASLQSPLQVEDRECIVTTSIGISIFPRDGEDTQTLMKHADAAMYSAKEKGRNRYNLYSSTMSLHAAERLAVEQELRKALERNEFRLHYQPQLDCKTNQVVGVEALLRWRHPEWGMVSPAEFIPLAEETGLIVPIGEWVLRTACQQNKAWAEAGYPSLRIAVNLSARQFQQENLVGMIKQVLQETQMQPQFLELEITESAVMQNATRFIGILHELKNLGIWLSIDDFGTGYSSLSYLRDFPINRLKIDRSFVNDITENEDAVIAKSIIAMAHSLQMNVLAEGVENEVQLTFLREQQCDEMQGYYCSKPLPAEQLEEWMQQSGTTALAVWGK
ncbi:putative bifunctional diguanylate cyclase/phosphodiesterase [Brevibacillus porteri]|uniref:putative bifunctional diguanylate cyclase/phosphodiesterase n=1 Tax=Brevibacillus porteri TaxID=2126350 RepID=UPI003D1BCA88